MYSISNMMLHEFVFDLFNNNSYAGEKLPNLLHDISRENFRGYALGK